MGIGHRTYGRVVENQCVVTFVTVRWLGTYSFSVFVVVHRGMYIGRYLNSYVIDYSVLVCTVL